MLIVIKQMETETLEQDYLVPGVSVPLHAVG